MNIKDKLNIIFSRYIVMFGGEFGRGKSLSLAALTWLEIVFTQKQNIISNMPLHYRHFEKNIKISPIIRSSQFNLNNLIKNSIIIHDEAHRDLFARNAASERNKFITSFSVGFRKDAIKYRGSLQFFDTLEFIMGKMLEMVIIPTFVNQYSADSEEDAKTRLEKKDFLVRWNCLDRKEDNEFDIFINLYPYINMYNTNYKPQQLVIDHEEYLEKMQMFPKKHERILKNNEFHIIENNRLWQEGLEQIKRHE